MIKMAFIEKEVLYTRYISTVPNCVIHSSTNTNAIAKPIIRGLPHVI